MRTTSNALHNCNKHFYWLGELSELHDNNICAVTTYQLFRVSAPTAILPSFQNLSSIGRKKSNNWKIRKHQSAKNLRKKLREAKGKKRSGTPTDS
jgi:hypothetical protein